MKAIKVGKEKEGGKAREENEACRDARAPTRDTKIFTRLLASVPNKLLNTFYLPAILPFCLQRLRCFFDDRCP